MSGKSPPRHIYKPLGSIEKNINEVQKKILNITELVIIGFIILGVYGFHEDTNSVSRFSIKSHFLRIGIDFLIIVTLLFRSILIIKNFSKRYKELGESYSLEKVVYGCCLISLLPDLTTWYQWNYFADLYLQIFILFSLPIGLWTVELIERASIEKNKVKNYGLAFMSFIIPIIGYTVYLSQIN